MKKMTREALLNECSLFSHLYSHACAVSVPHCPQPLMSFILRNAPSTKESGNEEEARWSLDAVKNALTQESKACFAVHHALNEFDPGHLSFYWTI